MIGAVVGVQPFGGARPVGHRAEGRRPALSAAPARSRRRRRWTDLRRARRRRRARLCDWLARRRGRRLPSRCAACRAARRSARKVELAGPVGERNLYTLRRADWSPPLAETATGLRLQLAAILATGNDAAVPGAARRRRAAGLPAELAHRVHGFDDPLAAPGLAGALIEGEGEAVADAARRLAARPGPIVRAQALASAELLAGQDYRLADLVEERSISTNIAAAGGNASLMAIG